MRIIYVGNQNNIADDGRSYNTESHIRRTLEKLGHEVVFLQEDNLPPAWTDLTKTADFFLYTQTWGRVTHEDLKKIESHGTPTVSFHLDLYSNIQRDGGMGIGSPFWSTQYVFSPEGSEEAKKIFKSHGINQFYLPAGVFEDECVLAQPATVGGERLYRGHDIVFVGGGKQYAHQEWPYRAKLITWLENTYGDRFVKYGWPERTVRGLDLNLLYADSKIVIGDSLNKDFKDTHYWSDRIYETTGRGGFMIHPRIEGLEKHFKDKQEVVFYDYNDWDQLKGLIDFYLENDQIREKIRLRGHKRTKQDHTYTNRMQEMLDVLKKEGAI